jgi:hypothetical protein
MVALTALLQVAQMAYAAVVMLVITKESWKEKSGV